MKIINYTSAKITGSQPVFACNNWRHRCDKKDYFDISCKRKSSLAKIPLIGVMYKKIKKTKSDGNALEISGHNDQHIHNYAIKDIDSKHCAQTCPEIQKPKKIFNFTFPDFGNNPNDAQKAEYIKSIKKYLFVNDKDTNLKAIEAIGKYGSYEDIDSLSTLLLSNDDEIIQAVSEAYVSINEPMASEVLIAAICGDKHNYKDETYIAILDGLKKLTKFSDETKEEKELILEPIRRLLEHKSEKVRMKAKEVLEGINNSWHHSTN